MIWRCDHFRDRTDSQCTNNRPVPLSTCALNCTIPRSAMAIASDPRSGFASCSVCGETGLSFSLLIVTTKPVGKTLNLPMYGGQRSVPGNSEMRSPPAAAKDNIQIMTANDKTRFVMSTSWRESTAHCHSRDLCVTGNRSVHSSVRCATLSRRVRIWQYRIGRALAETYPSAYSSSSPRATFCE